MGCAIEIAPTNRLSLPERVTLDARLRELITSVSSMTYRAFDATEDGSVDAVPEPIDSQTADHESAVEPSPPRCLICDATDGFDVLLPREMMMGTRETFPYRHCHTCRSISRAYDPACVDLADYYSDGYYAFRRDSLSSFKLLLRRQRDAGYFGRRSPVGRALQRTRPDPVLDGLARIGVNRDHRVLDVGCGSGLLVDRLAAVGFTSAQGIDPYLRDETVTPHGAPLRPAQIGDVDESFDVIMFHHVLEHIADPRTALSQAADRLTPGGLCVVRVPTSSSEAFRRYGKDWVQIDAPRHTAIPSRGGIEILAAHAGLVVEDVADDSTAFAFWGSEMVERDIPFDPQAADYQDPESVFTRDEMRSFAERADACNRAGEGDQFMATLAAAI